VTQPRPSISGHPRTEPASRTPLQQPEPGSRTPLQRLKGQAVVVTGGGGGIGRAIARAFAAEGAGVIVGDIDDGAEAAAAAIRADGGRAMAARADVTRTEDMQALAALAEREHGRLDVLVTCAGLGLSGLLAAQSEADWLRVIEVNLNGTYRAIRAALPRMMAQGTGRIVTIASVLGKMGGSGYVSAYVASKHGVIGITRALAAELGSQGYPGITVNAVCPGYTRAGMGVAVQSTKAGPRSGEEIFERYYKRQVPQRRMMEPEEIARVAVFLALPESAGITGQALNVDGGFVMS
jgi:NAD(P)-dependent dehydrogenase (short-subunit alcohol dehydrogenase family)